MSEKSTDLVVAASGMVERYAHLLPERDREASALARLKESVAGVMRSNPGLLAAAKGDTEALYGAVVSALRLGLTFDPAFGHAWLVPRKGKVCFQVGYKGLKELALRAGDVKGARVELVWPGDGFEYTAEPPMLRHTPDTWATKGPRTYDTCLGGYAVVDLEGGRIDFLVMRKDEIEARRDVSAAKGGPWSTWPVEMAKKTILAALLRRQRLSVADRDVATVLHADMMADVAVAEERAERQLPAPRGRTQPAADDVVDAEVEEKPAAPAERADAPHPRLLELADALAKHIPKNVTAGALLHYLAASGKATAPTKEAARVWADSLDPRGWDAVGGNIKAAIARRLADCGAAADPTGLTYLGTDHAPEATAAGLQGDAKDWPRGAAWGVGLAARSRLEKKAAPGEAALRKALEVPGGEEAVKRALRQVGAPWPTEDNDKGELAYIIEKHCQASAGAEDTVALLAQAITGEI